MNKEEIQKTVLDWKEEKEHRGTFLIMIEKDGEGIDVRAEMAGPPAVMMQVLLKAIKKDEKLRTAFFDELMMMLYEGILNGNDNENSN